jgi:alpha-amylase
VRYPESNNQHKKMLRVHDAVYAAGATEETGTVQLWKGQANDTYWHGLFGGVYMSHVRSAIYHHLIKAENAADRVRFGVGHWQRYEFTDFDRDSQNELLIESDQQNLYIDPQRGGTLFEWDLRRSMHNLLSIMSRQEEGYHQTLRKYEQERRRREAIEAQNMANKETRGESTQPGSPHTSVRTKEPDLDRYLVVDRYRRYSLIDHFLPPGVTLPGFAQAQFEEMGSFVEHPYAAQVQQDSKGLAVMLTRDGYVRRPGALGPLPIHLSKNIVIPRGEEKMEVRYVIENRGETRLQTRFASEWNINLLGGGGNDQAYYAIDGHELDNERFDSTGEVSQVRSLHIGNRWIKQDMGFSLSETATLWRFSIETVTGSEAGFERNHQGSCLTLIWPLLLEAGESWSVEIHCDGKPSL